MGIYLSSASFLAIKNRDNAALWMIKSFRYMKRAKKDRNCIKVEQVATLLAVVAPNETKWLNLGKK